MLARGAADDKGQIHAHADGRRGARWRRAARCRSTSSTSSRARRSRARRTSTRWLAANRERLAADVAIISDTGFFEGNLPAITLSLRGHDVRPDRRRRHATSTSTRAATAASSRTRPTRWPRSSRRSRAPTAGSASRASTTTSSPLTDDGARGARGAAVRRGGVPRASSACRRSSARPASRTLERRGRPADARRQRHLGRLPGRGHARRSSRPTPTPRSAAGSSPTRTPIGSSRRSEAYVEEIAPPGVTSTVTHLGGGRPSLTPIDHPGDAGRRAGARGDVRPGAGLHPRGRLDPGLRQLRVDPRPAGRAPRLQPAGRPRPRARTSGWTSATTRRASGRSSGCGTSWRPSTGPSWTPRHSPHGGTFGPPRWGCSVDCHAGRRCYDATRFTTAGRTTPRDRDRGPHRRQRRRPGASTPTPAAWRRAPRSTSSSTSTTRSRPASVGEYQPVPLGFTPLDKTIGTGLRAGELLLIGGAQGTGKTTMALQMARNVASGGQANVLYICFEHDEQYLLNRLIAMESALAHLPHKTGAIKIQDVRKEILGTWMAEGGGDAAARQQPAAAPVARPDRPLRPEPVPAARLADREHDRQHPQARPAAPRSCRATGGSSSSSTTSRRCRRSPSPRPRPRRSRTSSTASRTSRCPRTCR